MSRDTTLYEPVPTTNYEPTEDIVAECTDPRVMLAHWANEGDEWVRLLTMEVIATGRPISPAIVEKAYRLFRQEKALERRDLPVVERINIEARRDESAPPLVLTRLSDVHGVNALGVTPDIRSTSCESRLDASSGWRKDGIHAWTEGSASFA